MLFRDIVVSWNGDGKDGFRKSNSLMDDHYFIGGLRVGITGLVQGPSKAFRDYGYG